MYSYKEAVKILNYYSDKLIGKPIDEKKGKDFKITHLKIEELVGNTFNVFCYTRVNVVDFYLDIDSVATKLKLISPSEVLKENKDSV